MSVDSHPGWVVSGNGPAVAPPRSAAGRALTVAANLLTVLAVVALAAAVAALLLLRPGPNGETTLLGHPVLEVLSGSMTPTFNAGDLIVDAPLSSTQAEHLHPGQVISFQSNSAYPGLAPMLITHRIVGVSGAASSVQYRTKGDANNVADPGPVPAAAVVGLYQGQRIPDGAYVLSALHQPATFVILAVLLTVFLGAGEFLRRWRALGPTASAEPSRRARR